MATKTKAVAPTPAGVTTTFTVTDSLGSVLTLLVTQLHGGGITWTFANSGTSGGLHSDGQQTLMALLLTLSSGVIPS